NPLTMGDKRSNDKYWLRLASASGVTPKVRPDAGSNSLLSTTFKFNPGTFRTHFPYDTFMSWTGTGAMSVVDCLVPPNSGSCLSGVTRVSVKYTKDCPDGGGGGAAPGTPTITSSNGLFNFTLDGGLVASGPTTAPVDLQWGYIVGLPNYAQQALQLTTA